MHSVRLLERADIGGCMVLTEEAGWNQTEQDWLRLFEKSPKGCFGVDIDGALAGVTTVVCYGAELAWIGMVLTAARFRRQGIATTLIRHALDYAESRRLGWAKLDATEMGRPLYRRFSFEGECAVERWLRPGAGPTPFEEQSRHDGVNFALGRPGRQAAYFGPCHAESAVAAREMLEWFLREHEGEAIFWDLFPDNDAAVKLASEHGFAPARKLMRMGLRLRADAPPCRTDVRCTYAIAGFEWG